MSNTTTKRDKRSNQLCALMHEYLSPIVNKQKENKPESEHGAIGGIIRDRVCLYIADHYDVNFHMIRNYQSPTKKELEMVKKFVDDEVSYQTVRDYYHSNNEKRLSDQFKIDLYKKSDGYFIFDTDRKKFLRIEDGGVEFVEQGFASVVDEFMTGDMTQYVVRNLIDDLTNDVKNFILLNKGSMVGYHKAEF